jgi:hypothetical protein
MCCTRLYSMTSLVVSLQPCILRVALEWFAACVWYGDVAVQLPLKRKQHNSNVNVQQLGIDVLLLCVYR